MRGLGGTPQPPRGEDKITPRQPLSNFFKVTFI